jgi:transposase
MQNCTHNRTPKTIWFREFKDFTRSVGVFNDDQCICRCPECGQIRVYWHEAIYGADRTIVEFIKLDSKEVEDDYIKAKFLLFEGIIPDSIRK